MKIREKRAQKAKSKIKIGKNCKIQNKIRNMDNRNQLVKNKEKKETEI